LHITPACSFATEKSNMQRRTSRGHWIEALENRQLFAVSPVATPAIIGTFTGMTTDSNEKSPGTITAIVETQTHTGKLTGYVEIKFPHEHTHITYFTGKISGDSFTMTTDTTTVKGTVSDSGHVLHATYVFMSSDDNSTGEFDVTRPKHK
jgi:hypothetical protein